MYKAKVSFSGVVSMNVGEVADIADVNIAKDLIKAGYIEEVKPAEKAKPVKDTSNKKPTRTRAKKG
ncbi:MAG: hypothetical protein J6M62_07430 [Selenomonadaceae bacterium]|nr:hypothetical protein [Selenomonadaceae bacterium]